MKYKEEKKEYEINIKLLNVHDIVIPHIQRALSNNLVSKLMMSIEKVGFITPVVVVESDNKGEYEVIDGQHRLEACKLLGYTKIPAVIVPREIKQYIITLNTEKASNLKDKAHQAYEIYMQAYNLFGDEWTEGDLELMIEQPYYLTIGFIIERFEERRFSGFAWENVLKKIDNFYVVNPIKQTDKQREERAKLLIEANKVLNEKFSELAVDNHFLKNEIVNKVWQSIYGKRVRAIEDNYEIALNKIIEGIKSFSFEEVRV